jgi:copper chaperone
MHEFHLPDMTCGHCASTVNLTLKLVDPACEVSVDIASRKVQVSSREDRAALVEALTESGYPPAV